MINVTHLSKSFKPASRNKKASSIIALNDVSLEVANGEIKALLGPNGAGKTTFLRTITGLEPIQSGNVNIDGYSPTDNNLKQTIGFLSDGFGLYPRLTAYENIQYFANLHGIAQTMFKQRIALLDDALSLKPLLDQFASTLSLGQRIRVAIARTLIHDPQTLILDEPTNGLDLASVRKLRAFLKMLTTPEFGSKCILFSTHQMHEVKRLADNVAILVKGEIKVQGTVSDIIEQTQAQDFEDAFASVAYD